MCLPCGSRIFRRLGLAVLIWALGAELCAADRWSVGGGWLHEELYAGRRDTYLFAGTFYVDAINYARPAPYQMVAFVERPRALSVGYDRAELRATPLEGVALTVRDSRLRLVYAHGRPASPHTFAIGGQYGRTHADGVRSRSIVILPAESTMLEVNGQYGLYLRETWWVGLDGSWRRDRVDVGFAQDRAFDVMNASFVGRGLVSLGGRQSVAVRVAVGHRWTRDTGLPEDEDLEGFWASGSVAFFFTRQTGLEVNGGIDQGQNNRSLGASLTHFFSEAFALTVLGQRVFQDRGDTRDSWGVSLLCRF